MDFRKRTNAYWEKRAEEQLTLVEKLSLKHLKDIDRVYLDARKYTLDEVKKLYLAYYTKTGLDTQALASIAPRGDIRRFIESVARAGLITELPDGYGLRLTRLQLLEANIWLEASKAAQAHQGIQTLAHRETISTAYNYAMYNLAQGTGVAPAFAQLNTRVIDKILATKFYGKNYSERIWTNRAKLIDGIKRELATAVTTGQSNAKTARMIRDKYNVTRYEASRLVRTETNHFNTLGSTESYMSAGLEEFVYSATLDTKTSMQCFIGTDKISTITSVDKLYRRRYTGEIITITTASGNKLSGTPNHPILTSDGWLPLNKIEPNKHVVYTVAGDVSVVPGHKNINVPAKFSELFNSVAKVPTTKVLVHSASATDFHNDVTVDNPKVDVANINGVLGDGFNSGITQKLKYFLLRLRASTDSSLNSLKPFTYRLLGRCVIVQTSEVKIFSLGNLIKPRFRSSKPKNNNRRPYTLMKHLNSFSAVFVIIGVMLSSLKLSSKAKLLKSICHSGGGTPILFSQLRGGRTVPVFGDDVVDVSIELADRHVYNLQCDDNVYINNSILVHNCQELDGNRFKLTDNEHKPPQHPNCRSAMRPFIGEEYQPDTRIMRDPVTGENRYIPNMSYKQWRELYL